MLQTEWDGEFATIHPSLVLGPPLDKSVKSSLELILALANHDYPGNPPIQFDWVDVRDVAEAHVVATEHPAAKGRYITSTNQPGPISRFSLAMNKTHPDVGCPTNNLPWFVLWSASWCDGRLTKHFLYELCTPQAGYSSAKLQSELGYALPHTDLEVTLGDTLTAMKKLGMLKKKYDS